MLRVNAVSHSYGDIVALRGLSLELEAGEILCLLGPSGCGKTSLLRVIAGLEPDHSGAILFEGEDISALPPHKREFGLMFQDFALFPHMTVAQNIAYGLRRKSASKREIEATTRRLLDRVGLGRLEARDVSALSGGQKQRVALARSLAPNPRLLMLDEPLGSLDAQLRDQLALELRQIINGAGLSAIYVTHDRQEAYAVGDRIAVMKDGALQQIASPRALYRRPASAFVARFLGMRNIFPADSPELVRALGVEATRQLEPAPFALIHPSGLRLDDRSDKASPLLEGVLRRVVFRGDRCDLTVDIGDGMALAFAAPDTQLAPGDKVRLHVAPEAIIALPK